MLEKIKKLKLTILDRAEYILEDDDILPSDLQKVTVSILAVENSILNQDDSNEGLLRRLANKYSNSNANLDTYLLDTEILNG